MGFAVGFHFDQDFVGQDIVDAVGDTVKVDDRVFVEFIVPFNPEYFHGLLHSSSGRTETLVCRHRSTVSLPVKNNEPGSTTEPGLRMLGVMQVALQ